MQSDTIDLDDIQQYQPVMNIGTIGHVSHGKSTIVKGSSGKKPQQFSAEQVRNITIQLGYANCKIFHCAPCDFFKFEAGKTMKLMCQICKNPCVLKLHFSYVDNPGHESYMSTMLNGTAVMDAALLVIAANEPIPQPQTKEHLIAAELMNLKHGIVALNKLDLIDKKEAKNAYQKTKEFLAGTMFETKQTVPVCANHGMNLDILARHICELPIPQKDLQSPPKMIVIRSFDVSKSGAPAKEVRGGVAGGSLLCGVLRVGQQIEVRPGLVYQLPNQKGEMEFCYQPLITTVCSLFSEKTGLQKAIPGGLIGVGTKLDPALTKQNRLVGQMIGLDLPPVYDELMLEYKVIREFSEKKPFKKGESILVSVQSSEIPATVAIIRKGGKIIVTLSKPVCVDADSGNCKASLSKLVNQRWRLCGFATIVRGRPIRTLEEVQQSQQSESTEQ